MTTIKELETHTYTEYISRENAYKIVQNWSDILSNLPIKRQLKIRESINKGFDFICQLKKIVKQKIDIIHTKYNFSKNLESYGRLFAQNPSLASLPREIRNSLANHQYYDIDIKNCHCVLLSQYCSKNGIRSTYLDEYVTNRDELLNKISNDNGKTKEDIKCEILTIMNGGAGSWDISKIKGTFLHDFKKEIKKIHEQVCRLNPDEYKKVQRRKDYNKEGTMMNIILCKLEHNVLMNAVAYMRNEGYSVDVLIFDGFMIRKNKELTNETLINLQKYIKEKTEYDVCFIEKTMENVIDLSKYPNPVDEDKIETTYFKDKEEFEKTHLKIIHPAMYLTLIDDDTYDIQCEAKITSSYRHLKSTIEDEKGKPQKINFITKWINDENIRLYRKIVFIPHPAEYDKRDYNTWRDFRQEKIKLPNDFDINNNIYIEKYKDFITNLLGGVNECVMYFIAWCANIIQNPAKRSCICMVLYSLEEGAGKNMIIKTLELCLGEIFVNYISDVGNQLFGKHSSAEMNKLLIVLNEVKGKDTYANTDLFKTRITDDKREVELKGKDTIQITNYCSYIINSNNLNVVNAGEKDRRFCVLDCNNPRIHDKKYFKDYQRSVNDNPEAIRCIYEYLKTFKIEEVVPDYIFSDARPKTELYEELVECNKEKEWGFLEDLVLMTQEEKLKIKNEELWTLYRSYCNQNHLDISKLSSKRFLFIFNRTIVSLLDKDEEYKESILKYKSGSSRGYKLDLIKLRKYFDIDISIKIEKLTPVKRQKNNFINEEN